MGEGPSAKAFGRLKVTLVHDDIAARRADVLVNAANDQLQMGGGVAAALRSGGGIEIHQEAIRHAPAKLGSVVRTGAGALDARYVYHAVVIDYEIRRGTSAADVAVVVQNLVKRAVADDVRSMALPLFGAGVGGLSIEASLTTILNELEAAGVSVPQPLAVEIVVREAEEFDQAASVFVDYQSKDAREADEARLAEEAIRKLLGE
jgi:O-acetyl-ADP-ribose deacetylase (regulator of RNase III)